VKAGRFAAVDLGASSGRVIVGDVDATRVTLRGVHRFSNRPVRITGGLHWDVLGLYASTLVGLREAGRVDSIGIDTWAVDYALLDRDGALLGNPYCYRDSRTDAVDDKVHAEHPHSELFHSNGLQYLPFTTLYQLAAAQDSPQLAAAETLLLLPDLFAYWLTGAMGTELTNASTTGLLSVRTRSWDLDLCGIAGVDPRVLPPVRRPGEVLGTLLPTVAEETGLSATTPVVAVGSHDTASAVLAVPMDAARAAYVSLGTWGLVGVELAEPLLTEAARQAGFTNEIGVDGRVRFLRNVMGMWLLEECLRVWRTRDVAGLLKAAEAAGPQPQFDVQDPGFLPPGNMPGRIRAATDAALPERGQIVRSIVDSLVSRIASTVRDASQLSAIPVDQVHVVGGGSQNDLLCRLLARELGVPVVAGPVEATAIGNLLVQARGAGVLRGEIEDLRDLVGRTSALVTYRPSS
jgi:rhamnulokinase